MIERRPRHAEFARDILERRLAEAEVAEHARRGAQHFDPAVAEAIVGPPARLGDGSCRHESLRCPTCGLRTRGSRPRTARPPAASASDTDARSEEHTSELQSLMRISYAVFCLKKKNKTHTINQTLQKHKQ